MNEVSIRFLSMTDLSDFATTVGHQVFIISRDHLVLTGDFSEAEIELALNAFSGTYLTSAIQVSTAR